MLAGPWQRQVQNVGSSEHSQLLIRLVPASGWLLRRIPSPVAAMACLPS